MTRLCQVSCPTTLSHFLGPACSAHFKLTTVTEPVIERWGKNVGNEERWDVASSDVMHTWREQVSEKQREILPDTFQIFSSGRLAALNVSLIHLQNL